MGLIRYSFLTLLILVSCSDNDSGTDFNPPEGYESRSGELIYQQHCESCHGPDGTLGQAGAKDLTTSKLDSVGIENILRNGKNGMPRQMQNIETEEELNNIIDHIKSFRH